MTNVTCGASNDKTGNIQYGADWVMENTNENVKDIYFTSSIDNYTSSLVIFNLDNLTYSTSGSNATVTGSYDAPSNWNLTIPSSVTNNGETYIVTAIGIAAFYFKYSLIGVIIPNTVTTIGTSAFTGCFFSTSVTIGSSVTTIGNNAFQNLVNLTSVIIPNSVITIGSSAFMNCKLMSSVTIGSGVTSISSNAFQDCDVLSSVYFIGNIPNISNSNNFI